MPFRFGWRCKHAAASRRDAAAFNARVVVGSSASRELPHRMASTLRNAGAMTPGRWMAALPPPVAAPSDR